MTSNQVESRHIVSQGEREVTALWSPSLESSIPAIVGLHFEKTIDAIKLKNYNMF